MSWLLIKDRRRVGKFRTRSSIDRYIKVYPGHKYTIHKINTDWRSRRHKKYLSTEVVDTRPIVFED